MFNRILKIGNNVLVNCTCEGNGMTRLSDSGTGTVSNTAIWDELVSPIGT